MAKTVPVRGGRIGEGEAPVVCTPLLGRSVSALRSEAAALAAQRPDLLEWRIDAFEGAADPAALAVAAAAIREAAPGSPLLVTLRAAREGGADTGLDDAARSRLLAGLAGAGLVDIVDFETAADGASLLALRGVCRAAGVPLLLSAHDFSATPPVDALLAQFGRAAALGADIAKIAVTPRADADVTALLEATARADRALAIPVVSMSMGELGAMSRVLGHRFGSRITWASGLASSAPGQLPLGTLRGLVAASLAR